MPDGFMTIPKEKKATKTASKKHENLSTPLVNLSNQVELSLLQSQTKEDENKTFRTKLREGKFENKKVEVKKEERSLTSELVTAEDERIFFGQKKDQKDITVELVPKEKRPLKESTTKKNIGLNSRFQMKKPSADETSTIAITAKKNDEAHVFPLIKDMLQAGEENKQFRTAKQLLSPLDKEKTKGRNEKIKKNIKEIDEELLISDDTDEKQIFQKTKTDFHHLSDMNQAIEHQKELLNQKITNRLLKTSEQKVTTGKEKEVDDWVDYLLKRRREEEDVQENANIQSQSKKDEISNRDSLTQKGK